MECQIVILAGGNGTRMDSILPKVLHKIKGRPMLEIVLENARKVTDDIIIVHSPILFENIKTYQSVCKFALQEKPLGTAQAVFSALTLISKTKVILVIYGDNPFISSNTITRLLEHVYKKNTALSTLAFLHADWNECGKLVIDERGNFLKIVEFKKATGEEKTITLCNSGVMGFNLGILHKYLPDPVKNRTHSQDEFYITELVEICQKKGEKVAYLLCPNNGELISINTREDLLKANGRSL